MLCSYEDVYKGEKYVLFDGDYNYTQAAAKCTEHGGALAMATDTDTFNFTLNLYNDYYKSGGLGSGMFLDGSKGVIMNSLSNVWYCVNVQGTCPATMPWRQGSPAPGGPNHTNCAGMLPWLLPGVADLPCQRGLTAMCTVSPTNFHNIRNTLRSTNFS